MQRRLHEKVTWLESRDRREALLAELAAARPARWTQALRDAQTPAEVEAVAAARGDWDVVESQLSDGMRFNLGLARLREALANMDEPRGPMRDSRTLALGQVFVLEYGGLMKDAGAEKLKEVLTWATGPEARDVQRLAEAGPGAVGWTLIERGSS